MITIDNKLKEAFKAKNREIKGYVEILYNDVSMKSTASFSSTITPHALSKSSEVFDGDRVGSDYGALETDYFQLNGTQVIANDTASNNTGIGFISNDIFSNIANPTFTITNSSSNQIEGLTIYFQRNIPTSLTAVINGTNTYNITNNKRFVQITFNSPTVLSSAVITINSVERNDWRIRIQEIDFGLTGVYEGNEILNIETTEQVSKLVENLPVNEMSVTIDNYSKQFDPINPAGLTRYLNSTTVIRPYIGAVTDEGVKYMNVGNYFLYDWKNNSDGTTTFIGRNIMENINNEPLTLNTGNFFDTIFDQTDFINYMNNNYNYNLSINFGADNATMTQTYDQDRLAQFIAELTLRKQSICYADRNNVLTIKAIDNTVKETIHRTDMLADANYKTVDKINTVEIIKPGTISSALDEPKTVDLVSTTVQLSKTNEIFSVKNSNHNLWSLSTISHTGGSDAQVVQSGTDMAFIRVTGSVGDTVSITGTGEIRSTYEATETITRYSNKGIGEKENIFTFNSRLNWGFNNTNALGNYILSNAYQYQVDFNYIGLPYLEAGDTINIETPYGTKSIFIEKIVNKFDGGLGGTIVGVGN